MSPPVVSICWGLPTGVRLHLGCEPVIEVTGLSNPCGKLNKIQAGLMKATLARDVAGNLIRKAGIMAIILAGDAVRAGDDIEVEVPREPRLRLDPV